MGGAVVIGALGIVSLTVAAVAYWVMITFLTHQLECDFLESIVEPARMKLNGNNRFILNREVLDILVPPSTPKVVRNKLWRRFVETHVVVRDPYDDEWCIRP